MTNIGFEVGQPGKIIPNSRDYEKILSSQIQTMPVFDTFFKAYSLNAGGDQVIILKHKLPFVPYFQLYYKNQIYNDKWTWFPGVGLSTFFAGNLIQIIYGRVDKENITFRLHNGEATTQIITIKILIFAFPVALSM